MNGINAAIFWQLDPLWKWWGGQENLPSLLSVALVLQFRRSYFGNTLFTSSLDVGNVAEVYILQTPVRLFLHVIWMKIAETWAASGSTPWGRPLPLARAAKLLDATLPEKEFVSNIFCYWGLTSVVVLSEVVVVLLLRVSRWLPVRLAAASPEPTTGTGTVYFRGFRPTYLAGCLRLSNIKSKAQCNKNIVYDLRPSL